VDGEPKLADVGLVGDSQRPEEQLTWIGTPGFMPPDTEPPGTVQADIFALGMVLYVVSTGKKPTVFPDLTATLVDQQKNPDFAPLSEIIFKACTPNRAERYASAAELRAALEGLPG
jgi:serine/threonine protein kinase